MHFVSCEIQGQSKDNKSYCSIQFNLFIIERVLELYNLRFSLELSRIRLFLFSSIVCILWQVQFNRFWNLLSLNLKSTKSKSRSKSTKSAYLNLLIDDQSMNIICEPLLMITGDRK